jgi:hypothetical protein
LAGGHLASVSILLSSRQCCVGHTNGSKYCRLNAENHVTDLTIAPILFNERERSFRENGAAGQCQAPRKKGSEIESVLSTEDTPYHYKTLKLSGFKINPQVESIYISFS